MRKIATAFMGEDGHRIYAEVSEAEYQRVLAQLQDEDYDAFAKFEFNSDDGTTHVGILIPAAEFLEAAKKAGEEELLG